MKWLKYFLFVALALVGIALIRGLMTPHIQYSESVTVDASVEEAWQIMNDESKVTEWLQGIVSMEHLSGQKGQVGAVTQYTFEQNGRKSELIETIKEIKQNDYVSMDFEMEDVMDMDYRVEFDRVDGKTKISSSSTVSGATLMMRIMMPMMKSAMIDQEQTNLSNLKEVIEKNTGETR